jgi:HTH-type transcriptional regulator, competence development regulator
MSEFGERIKSVRQELGIGLREAATKLSISAAYLSRIENGQEPRQPTEKIIQRISDLLEEDFDELMYLAGRVAEDVAEVVKCDPQMPAFLRNVREKNVSAAELISMLTTRNP